MSDIIKVRLRRVTEANIIILYIVFDHYSRKYHKGSMFHSV